MATVEVDAERVAETRMFDPLTTPYEVDSEPFPLQGSLQDQFIHLLRYAILAPSSHNTQPWKFQLHENGIAVFADYTRRLPVSDPNHRELLMGVGAAIQNVRLATTHFGFDCRVDYNFSNDSELPIAFARLNHSTPCREPDESTERLFFSIPKRHTNRNPFLMARVPETVLTRLCSLGEGTSASILISSDAKHNSRVAHLVAQAERAQQADGEFRKELAEWLRPNKTHEPDGIPDAAFGISDVASAVSPWEAKTIDMGGFRVKHDERLCIEAPALLVLHGEESVQTWLAVGEVMQKVLLSLTSDGLQFSFFNMPIEVPDARLELQHILGTALLPQLLIRIGYSLEKPALSPRRSVEDCIV